ncbi:GNAT family N-acetyltransferase [Nitrosomonas mobilis]|uniref:BioF2-like acetyltransferase domain-containing protein n=1 Tax=Nitrosomonas mobilis TaxID=51642 RepID=A0A1G5SH79_9PROT|nr:GNAT family N-acetyltransferase [Nitrosomonas mobilis]SCZ85901.1 conserved hypothetical protein [Nitrosomonas mobilis]
MTTHSQSQIGISDNVVTTGREGFAPEGRGHSSTMGINVGWMWKDLDHLNTRLRSELLLAIKAFIRNHPDAVMDHDPDWLYTKCSCDKSVKIFVCLAKDGSLLGYAPFFVHPSTLSYELFGVSLFEFRIRRYSITGSPLLSTRAMVDDSFLQDLFGQLRGVLERHEVMFGLGVNLDSHFGRFVRQYTDLQKWYQIFPSGKSYCRRLIIMPESFEQYIKELSHNTRKDVRRTLRDLEKNAEIAVSYRVFTAPEDVPEFLSLAQSVSGKTYQRKLLGLGISDNTDTRQNLILAAEKGWLRSYILLCNNEPVAYQHGFLHSGVYYAEQTGYDPSWSGKSVGTIMQIYRIRDLIDIGVAKLDFLYGDNEKKRSLSNSFHQEQNYYFVPRKFPVSGIAYGLRLFNAITGLVGDFMEKNGIKSKIRRFLRARATRDS